MGICDRVGLLHEPYSILSQRQFRQREWYNDDAAARAEVLRPEWFTVRG